MLIPSWIRSEKRRCSGNFATRRARTRLAVHPLEARDVPSWTSVGTEFQANTTTEGNQGTGIQRYGSAVAIDADGDFVVAWRGQGGSGEGHYAQRFDSAGIPVGSEFQLNSPGAFLASHSYQPVIAGNPDGSFTIAWAGALTPGGSPADLLYARQFDPNGIPLGPEIVVHQSSGQNQHVDGYSIASDSFGNFVVAYARPTPSQNGSTPGYDIYARRFSSSGTAMGSGFQVNTRTQSDGWHWMPDVAISATGDFVVSWQSDARLKTGGSYSWQYSILARRFSAVGTALGPQFTVDSVLNNSANPDGNVHTATVAMSASGPFVVAWSRSDASTSGSTEVFAKRYDSSGNVMGTAFPVNTYTIGGQSQPQAAMDASGRFAIAWQSNGQDGDGYGVFAQAYDAAGLQSGAEFRANSYTTNHQYGQSIAVNAAGDAVIAWLSLEQDGSGHGVYAQRYEESARFLSIGDVTTVEGHAGTTAIEFTVTLSAPSTQTVTVEFLTANGTASAGSDYQSTGGTLTFLPGEVSKTVSVPIVGDRLGESNETFFVNLSNPFNAELSDGQGAGTIVDDEPRISINDVSLTEGNAGTKIFEFRVTLSAIYDQTVTVSFRTLNGSATSTGGQSDFVAQTGLLTFLPNDTEETISIVVKGDTKKEANETFSVELFNPSNNAWLFDSVGLGTILNDD